MQTPRRCGFVRLHQEQVSRIFDIHLFDARPHHAHGRGQLHVGNTYASGDGTLLQQHALRALVRNVGDVTVEPAAANDDAGVRAEVALALVGQR